MTIHNQIVEVGGCRWLIREADTMEHALDAIAHARCTGSIGARDILDETRVGGGVTVQGDVVQINSDGSERQPYTAGY